MIVFTILSILAVLTFALASTFEVQVGAGGSLEFSPASIGGVADGDTINFIFNPENHTVTQSSVNTPCRALPGGFSTGFVAVTTGTTVKSFIVPAGTGTNPLRFYGGQVTHCQSGMVFAVNAPQTPSPNTFDTFKYLAIRAAALSSLDSATDTLGSHNPTTFSGSIATAASVNDGPTGSFTSGLSFTTASTSLGSASGSASGSTTAPASTGKSSGAVSSQFRESALTMGALFFGLVASIVQI